MIKTLIKTVYLLPLALLGLTAASRAQLNPFQYMYYQDRYILNPALAGTDQGMTVNLGYRRQWNNLPGAPKTGILTAQYRAADKVGLGLNIQDDHSGLIHSTRVVGTYAYHLPLNGEQDHLSFGLSLGVNDSRVDYNEVVGDVSDEEIAQYNQLKPYIDGDFGAAYTGERLMISASLPNLKSTFFKESDTRFDTDRLLMVTAISYKLDLSNPTGILTLEPLAGFRIIKGYKNIVDAGLNFTMHNYGLYLQTIYHSNETLGMGIGMDQKSYLLNFSYNLETGRLRTLTHGAFELGLKLKLFAGDKK